MMEVVVLRASLARANTQLVWTDTRNMLADCLTKQMDPTYMLERLRDGQWSYRYDESVMKPTKVKYKFEPCSELTKL